MLASVQEAVEDVASKRPPDVKQLMESGGLLINKKDYKALNPAKSSYAAVQRN